MNHPDRVRRHYLACEIGDAPHAFHDTVNGRVLGHGFRDGVTFTRVCRHCGISEAQILATPEHSETAAGQ